MGRVKIVREHSDKESAVAECAWCVRQYGKRFCVGVDQQTKRYFVVKPGELDDMGLTMVHSKKPQTNRNIRRTKEEQLEIVRHWRRTVMWSRRPPTLDVRQAQYTQFYHVTGANIHDRNCISGWYFSHGSSS